MTRADIPYNQERLVKAARQLTMLYSDPHPGLFTWNDAVWRAIRELAAAVDDFKSQAEAA